MRISERIEQLRNDLHAYKQRLGLGSLVLTNDVDQYLNWTQDQLKKLSKEELLEAAALIYPITTYIQLEINKNVAVVKWCEKYLNYLFAQQYNQVGDKYTPAEIRRNIFIKNDEVAKELNKIIGETQSYIDQMENIPWDLKAFAKSLEGLAACKK